MKDCISRNAPPMPPAPDLRGLFRIDRTAQGMTTTKPASSPAVTIQSHIRPSPSVRGPEGGYSERAIKTFMISLVPP